MRRVETENSFWIFDEDRMLYCRMPKSEAPTEHSDLPYSLTEGWREYTDFKVIEYDNFGVAGCRKIQIRDTEIDHRLRTGFIINDTAMEEVS